MTPKKPIICLLKIIIIKSIFRLTAIHNKYQNLTKMIQARIKPRIKPLDFSVSFHKRVMKITVIIIIVIMLKKILQIPKKICFNSYSQINHKSRTFLPRIYFRNSNNKIKKKKKLIFLITFNHLKLRNSNNSQHRVYYKAT